MRAAFVVNSGRVAVACALLLSLRVAGAGPLPARLPDLDAIVTYETRQVLGSGVMRHERWQERLVRRGDTVWTERLLPQAARAAHARERSAEHAAHKHFDFDAAARLVRRNAAGATQLQYVDARHRIVVGVPAAEYGAVGFDGRWEAAASVIPAAVVRSMRPESGMAHGRRWHAENDAKWTHRVHWSDALQIALQVESVRRDGSYRRIVTVEPAKASDSSPPWAAIGTYTQKDYDDFMD